MATQEPKTVAFVLYPGLTLLDLVGPLQVFASLRRFSDQYRPVVVAERIEPMATDGPLTVTADHTFADVPDPTVVIVPGGDAPTIKAMGDPAIREYLRHAADTAPGVRSVCTGALVLAAAGLYELTPAKARFLRRCRDPVGFLMSRWRGSPAGALRLGVEHGLVCLGCCWALMAVLVVAAAMGLAWAALIALVVFAEKVLPGERIWRLATAAALFALAIVSVV